MSNCVILRYFVLFPRFSTPNCAHTFKQRRIGNTNTYAIMRWSSSFCVACTLSRLLRVHVLHVVYMRVADGGAAETNNKHSALTSQQYIRLSWWWCSGIIQHAAVREHRKLHLQRTGVVFSSCMPLHTHTHVSVAAYAHCMWCCVLYVLRRVNVESWDIVEYQSSVVPIKHSTILCVK